MQYRGMFQAMFRVGSDEGPRALWKGLSPALLRQVSYTGLTFVLYEPVRDRIAGKGVKKEDIPFWKRVLSGGLAGGASIYMANPTDVVKTQMQASKANRKIRGITRDIWKVEGISGFWRGWSPNVARCFIGNACEIGCYDQAKTSLVSQGWLSEGPLAHFAASTIAGTISAIFSTPVDVVKTRLMNAAGGNKDAVQYTGVIDCFMKLPRQEGVTALYRGFWPIAARKVLWTVCYFLCYEQALKVVRGKYS